MPGEWQCASTVCSQHLIFIWSFLSHLFMFYVCFLFFSSYNCGPFLFLFLLFLLFLLFAKRLDCIYHLATQRPASLEDRTRHCKGHPNADHWRTVCKEAQEWVLDAGDGTGRQPGGGPRPGSVVQAGRSETGPCVMYKYEPGQGDTHIRLGDASTRVTIITGACASKICTAPEPVAK